MPTITQYLSQLQNDKQTLVDNLIAKGVEASNDETFTTLVPKVNNIETGGGDIGEYFPSTFHAGGRNTTYTHYHEHIKKVPKFELIASDVFCNIGGLFQDYKAVEEIDLSGVNTSEITLMNGLFDNCLSLTNLDLSGFNTSKVTTMADMFYNCKKITSLDLSGFDMSSVSHIQTMFGYCNALTNLRFGSDLGKGFTQKSNNYSQHTLSLGNSTLLTHDSLMDIINKVYDLNLTYDVANGGTLYTQKLLLGSTNMAKLTADEIAIATNKGWTVS